MNKAFPLFLIGLFSFFSSAWGDETHPFVDQNHITSIIRVGHQLILTTANGQKTFDMETKLWTYQVSIPTPTPIPSDGNDRGEGGRSGWFVAGSEMDSYGYTYIPTEDEKISWTLYKHNPWEPPDYPFEVLQNPDYDKCFNFPDAYEFNSGLIFKGQAWMASNKGLIALDLETGKTVWYLTYPLFPILKYQKEGARTFYLSSEGAYFLEGAKVYPIPTEPEIGPAEYLDLLADGNKVFILTGPIGRMGFPSFGKQKLQVYELDSKKFQSFPIPVLYSHHLIKRGSDIIGYGLFHAVDEENASFDFTHGGAFSFSTENDQMKKLTDLPVVELTLEPFKARALVFKGLDLVTASYLTYSQEKGKLVTSASEKIHYDYTNENENKKLKLKDVDWIQPQAIKEDLSAIPVEYQTIPRAGETLKVETRPWKMFIQKPAPTPTPENTPVPTPTLTPKGILQKWMYH